MRKHLCVLLCCKLYVSALWKKGNCRQVVQKEVESEISDLDSILGLATY